MEDRDHAGSLGGGAGELCLELLEHDPEAEGDAVSDHVDEEGGGHHHPAVATVRSNVDAAVHGGAHAHHGARHGQSLGGGRVFRQGSVPSLSPAWAPAIKEN